MNFILSWFFLFYLSPQKPCKSSPSFSEPLHPSFLTTIIGKWWLLYIYESTFFKKQLGKILMSKNVIIWGEVSLMRFLIPRKWSLLLMLSSDTSPIIESQIYNHTATVHRLRRTWHKYTQWITPTATESFSSHLPFPHTSLQKVLISRNAFSFPCG